MNQNQRRHAEIIGRAGYLGALWGSVFGGAAVLLVAVGYLSDGGLVSLIFLQPACFIGGVVGGVSGLLAGSVLFVAGPVVTSRMPLARLVTAGVATVIPLLLAGWLSRYLSQWAFAALAAGGAAVVAALLTPRIVNGFPPPRGPGVTLPPPAHQTAPAPTAEPPFARDNDREPVVAVEASGRWLLLGRGVGWGLIGGTALGAFTWTVWCVEFGHLKPLALVGFAALLGAAVGSLLGLAAGSALALAGRWAVRSVFRAQLITAVVVTAILLAIVHLSPLDTLWGFALSLNPSLAVAAALAAVLLTPCIVTGAPVGRKGRPGGTAP